MFNIQGLRIVCQNMQAALLLAIRTHDTKCLCGGRNMKTLLVPPQPMISHATHYILPHWE